MTTYTITWGRILDRPQRTETLTTNNLGEGLRQRFARKVGRPWTRPIKVQTHDTGGRCGYFHVWGRRSITGTWWVVEA